MKLLMLCLVVRNNVDGTGDGLQFIQILARKGGKPGCRRCPFGFSAAQLSQVAFTPQVRLNMSANLLVAANEPLKEQRSTSPMRPSFLG